MKTYLQQAWRSIKCSPSGLMVATLILFFAIYCFLWQIFEPADIAKNFCINRWICHIFLALILSLIITLIMEFSFRKWLWKMFFVAYESHNQNIGWTNTKKDGEVSGSLDVGLRLEAIRIRLGEKMPVQVGIRYQVHLQNMGWQESKSDGQMAGTEGQCRQIEAIKIALTNAPNNYAVFYSVRFPNNEWSQWYKNDEIAGTQGQSKAIEAIRIIVVNE